MNRKRLLEIIGKAKKDIESSPNGILKVVKHRNNIQYSIREDEKDFNGRYITKDDLELARKLAQKEYACKILKESERQLKILDRYLEEADQLFARRIWKNFNPLKKNLIRPYELSDEEFIEQWKAEEYRKSNTPFDKNTEWFSNKGVRVRSSSEKMIADLLEANDIPYRYEFPYVFKTQDQFGEYIPIEFHPDFTVLNKRTRKEYIWEHFGMMDRERYRMEYYSKMSTYNQHGYYIGENMIATFSEDSVRMRKDHYQGMIDRYLK